MCLPCLRKSVYHVPWLYTFPTMRLSTLKIDPQIEAS
jgi:hypothetical protein